MWLYNVSYVKGCVPYQNESIIYCVSPNNNMNLLKKEMFPLNAISET